MKVGKTMKLFFELSFESFQLKKKKIAIVYHTIGINTVGINDSQFLIKVISGFLFPFIHYLHPFIICLKVIMKVFLVQFLI